MWNFIWRKLIVLARGCAQPIPEPHPWPVTLICVMLLFPGLGFCSLWLVILLAPTGITLHLIFSPTG